MACSHTRLLVLCCGRCRAAAEQERRAAAAVVRGGIAVGDKSREAAGCSARVAPRTQDRRRRLLPPNLPDSGIITQERRQPARCCNGRYWPGV